jgi:hypothetical protein
MIKTVVSTAMHPQRKPPVNGFVLPLAISTSIVLLIGSASLHTLALQARSPRTSCRLLP